MNAMIRTASDLKPYLGGLAAVSGALAVSLLIDMWPDVHSTARVFLLAVLISAIAYGLWPALFASLISAIAYDYFFLPPVYSLDINSNQGIIDFACFVLSALLVSALAARVRRYALAADARALTAENLSAFTQCLANASTLQEVLDDAAERMSLLLHMPVSLILTEVDVPVVNAACPANLMPDAQVVRRALAWWALRPEQNSAPGFMIGDWRFHTLRGAGEILGLIATQPGRDSKSIRYTQDTLLVALGCQTGFAIDRCKLHERLGQSRARVEAERLRSTVLASISHDLRNPLASIMASASILERQWALLDNPAKLLMAQTIRGEAERLDDFICKLLDLTRLESKVIAPQCKPVSIAEVVGATLRQASSVLANHRVVTDLSDDLPCIRSDVVLLQQVLFNLFENAVKYSLPATQIEVVAHCCGADRSVAVTVMDEGPGIPDAELEKIFDRFYRSPTAAREVMGNGLGLAICRGFMEVMHGTIRAANRTDRSGASFTLTLPIAIQQELQEVES